MKKIISIALAGSLLFALHAGEVNAAEQSPGLTVNGRQVEFNESLGYPYLSAAGQTMMPVRACLNAIGCEVEWDGTTGTVITKKGGTEVDIPIGKNEIYAAGQSIPVSTPAMIVKDKTYLPLRAVLEAYGYSVGWNGTTQTVSATSEPAKLTPFTVNGGTTGIFSRKQLAFDGFTGIQGDVTLPYVTIADKSDCPYVYFGFDWENDIGNAEGGFQFLCDPADPNYNHWTVFLRQGDDWTWGQNIVLDPGRSYHLSFYSERVSETQTDLVIALDGCEVVRKPSAVADFSKTSVKAVNAMGMLRCFDGTNCFSKSEGTKLSALQVSKYSAAGGSEEISDSDTERYKDFSSYALYSLWRPEVGKYGMLYGTADCIPYYLHDNADGSQSIYKGEAAN